MEPIERDFELQRLIFFSDAVFAIAITLLALTLVVPDLGVDPTDQAFLTALGGQGMQFLAFIISFAVIGEYWIGHHRIFAVVFRWDGGLLVLNLLFLLTIVVLPWPTEMIARYFHLASVTAIYAGAVTACGAMLVVLFVYARRRGLLVEMPAPRFRNSLMRTLVSPVVFAVSIPVAFASPVAAKVLWLALVPLEVAYEVRMRRDAPQ